MKENNLILRYIKKEEEETNQWSIYNNYGMSCPMGASVFVRSSTQTVDIESTQGQRVDDHAR